MIEALRVTLREEFNVRAEGCGLRVERSATVVQEFPAGIRFIYKEQGKAQAALEIEPITTRMSGVERIAVLDRALEGITL